jgi:hypothetical protein
MNTIATVTATKEISPPPVEILDVRSSGRIPKLACASEMAAALRAESDGGGHRRLSLVAHGHRLAAEPDVAGVGAVGGDPGGRHDVFSEGGIGYRGRGITTIAQRTLLG